jgi:hypothetical protein
MSTCYYGTARRPVDGYLLPVDLKVTANLLNEILTASSHEAHIDRIFMAYGKFPVFCLFQFSLGRAKLIKFGSSYDAVCYPTTSSDYTVRHLIKKGEKIVSPKV